MDNKDAILEKIKKLLRLAADDPESPESKLAMEKAGELMGKYSVSVHETQEIENEKFFELPSSGYDRKNISWEGPLAMSLCKVFHCKCLLFLERLHGSREIESVLRKAGKAYKDQKYLIVFFGEKHDIKVLEWFFDYLRLVIGRKGDKFLDNHPSFDRKSTIRGDYCYGIVLSVHKRLEEMYSFREQAMTPETKALVPVKVAEVQKFMEDTYSVGKKEKRKNNDNGFIIGLGYKEGKNVSLNRPLGESKVKAEVPQTNSVVVI